MNGKRKYNRYFTRGRLPGVLTRIGSLEKIQNIEIINISFRGLGLISDAPLPKGSQLTLKLEGEEPVVIEVSYCNIEIGRSSIKYNIGLFCRHETKSLTKLLVKHGVEIIGDDQETALAS